MNWNPKAHDIFRAGPNHELNACVGTNGGPYDFLDYGRGYLLAAIVLCEGIEHGGCVKNVKIYPTVFLLRHGIELYLRECSLISLGDLGILPLASLFIRFQNFGVS